MPNGEYPRRRRQSRRRKRGILSVFFSILRGILLVLVLFVAIVVVFFVIQSGKPLKPVDDSFDIAMNFPTALPREDPAPDPNAGIAPAVTPTPDGEVEEGSGADVLIIDNQTPSPLKTPTPEVAKAREGVRNVLLIGVDRTNTKERGRTDSMILATLDNSNRVVKLTSFMRDLYVYLPGHGSTRLNAAYVYGGLKMLYDTFDYNFHLSIDNYVLVDFFTMVDLVDSLGGIEMKITSAEATRINESVRNYQSLRDYSSEMLSGGGTYTLNGAQVVGFSRIRKLSGGEYQRTQRQRDVLTLIYQKVATLNTAKQMEIALKLMGGVNTDLTLLDIMNLLPTVMEYGKNDIAQLRIPLDDAYDVQTIRGMWVMVPDLDKNNKALQEFLYGPTKQAQ